MIYEKPKILKILNNVGASYTWTQCPREILDNFCSLAPPAIGCSVFEVRNPAYWTTSFCLLAHEQLKKVVLYFKNLATVKLKNIDLIVQFKFVLCRLIWVGACVFVLCVWTCKIFVAWNNFR